MKTTRNLAAIEYYSETSPPNSIALEINSIQSGGHHKSNFIIFLTKIVLSCSLGLMLLASCDKTDELTPIESDVNMNYKAAIAAYYVAPNGSDAASGDITHPFATLTKVWTVISPGDLVYMRGGTYSYTKQWLFNKNGTATQPIKVWAYPGEIPIITKNPGFVAEWPDALIYLRGDYFHFKGIEIANHTQTSDGIWCGLRSENSNYNTFELLNIHDCGGGLYIVNEGTSAHSTGNLVLNCDFHHNQDPLSGQPYGDADGLGIQTISHTNDINTVTGCRFWNNSDDGIDLDRNEGTVIVQNCWSWSNGYVPYTSNSGGDGNGFKLGLPGSVNQSTIIKRKISNCVSYKNRTWGYHENSALMNMELDNNISYLNYGGYHLNVGSIPYVLRNNIAYGNINDVDFNTQSVHDHNSWDTGVTITNADFVSLSSNSLDAARQSDGSLPIITFLNLIPNSDLVDAGINIGFPFSGIAPDIGAFEYIGSTNQPPVIQNQTFQLSKTSVNGTVVGTVIASDPNAGQTLTYSILSGNTGGAFAISSSTGKITVANSTALGSGTGGTSYSIFQSITPSSSQNYIGNGASPLEVGMKFRSSVNGYISGFRFYKGIGSQGLHKGTLWSNSGTKLATATFSGESSSGWQSVSLGTPIAITANTIYVVSYFSQHGDYVKTYPYFTADVVNGPLTRLGWSASQPNGVYRYTATSAFPNNNAYIGSTNYWADVIFTTTTAVPASFALIAKVIDNGTGNLSNQATVSINLQ
jgi:hypothetical protein